MTRSLLLSISLFICQFVHAQSTSLIFEVNMNEQMEQAVFNADTDFVDIAGSFNSWGAPNGLTLQDEDADGIYLGNTTLNIGQSIEFKARINGEWNGLEEFAGGGPNRSYTVSANDTVSFWYNDEVSSNVLVADFSASTVYALPGEVIQFSDQSSGNPISWTWSFEGGIPTTSNDQNPFVTFGSEGQYAISLTVTDADGNSETKSSTNYISIGNKTTNWWNESVFYEIFVRSFYDENGDGKGDFIGLIEKLDYLNDGKPATHNDLGITGIWLMPMQESPSYHGYDVTDYRKVEPDYGTNEDFKLFMAEAHKRGIKVIIDYVLNHSSNEHPWFIDSKNNQNNKRNWYVWEDSNPGGNGPWGQQVWHQSNGDYYYGIFWGGMPDLNYETAAVKAEMFDIASFWLTDMQIDGFRLDAVKYIFENEQGLEDTDATFQFWKDFRAHYKSVNSEVFAVGEAWTSTDKASKYVVGNSLDYVFEFDLAGAMLGAVQSGTATQLSNKLAQVMSSYPYLQFGTFLTNHDMNRVMDVLSNDQQKAKLAANLLLSLPGIPYLYYGEEIGMNGSKPDEDIRLPMQWNSTIGAGFSTGTPWRAPKADFSTKNVASQQLDTSSLWSTYHELIAIRNTQPALQKGDFIHASTEKQSLFAGLRQFEGESILVCINLGTTALEEAQLSITNTSLAAGNYTLVDLKSGMTLPLSVASNGAISLQFQQKLLAQQGYLFKVMAPDATHTSVNLMIDMNTLIAKNTFLPESETVDLVSNQNAFGENIMNLTDENDDGIYTISISQLPIGQQLNYKYRINAVNDDRSEFKDAAYLRSYRIREGENLVYNQYNESVAVVANKQKMKADQLVIYPNPASRMVKIKRAHKQLGANITYQLIGLDGKIYQAGELAAGQTTIELTAVADGLYMLLFLVGNEPTVHKLIVKH